MAPLIVRHSQIHGSGVFAARDIAAGEEVVEYAGRRMTHAQADVMYPDDDGHTFLYILNDQYIIDAGIDGNEARFINHSCDPNCDVWLIDSDDGDPINDRLVIQAMRPIEAGEELTYDYGVVAEEPDSEETRALWRCRCGSPNCKGTMLETETGQVSG